jgi:hypothetical protein
MDLILLTVVTTGVVTAIAAKEVYETARCNRPRLLPARLEHGVDHDGALRSRRMAAARCHIG